MCWWKESVVYQIYPRSFKDSNGDGIGDLRGIISEIDYLSALGIDVIWLSPIYKSPQADNGYDISDYQQIDASYGSMDDFELLVSLLHEKKIKLIMDLVVNHTSDEHFWFKQARTSRDNKYYNYYHWWPQENGPPPKRWSSFDPQSNAWTYNEPTRSFYLHYFSNKQPDLNWDNQSLRSEIYSMMRFWLNKKIDGFRMDVITLISKDLNFPNIPDHYNGDWFKFYAHGPRLHEYLREMNDEVLSKYDIMTVAEGIGIGSDEVLDFVHPDRHELNTLYHFEGVGVPYLTDTIPHFNLVEFKRVHTKWETALAESGWGTIYLGNHDQPRIISRWGDGESETAAKLLGMFLLTMRGTPYLYQGDELGMSDPEFRSIEEYRDIATLAKFDELVKEKGDTEAFMKIERRKARDNSRTPMQWSGERHAGFTSAENPWISVNRKYGQVNAERETGNADSVLNFYRKLIQFRKEHRVLVFGDYKIEAPDDPHIYAYTRRLQNEQLLVLLNFSPLTRSYKMINVHSEPLINNCKTFTLNTLLPWQAVLLKSQ